MDSTIAKESNIAVKEITNGCLCCVLVGQLGDALRDIAENIKPDRVIIETSGSAYPGPLAWEVNTHAPRVSYLPFLVFNCVLFPKLH